MPNDFMLALMFFLIGCFAGHAYTIVKVDWDCYVDGVASVRGNDLTCPKGIDHNFLVGIQK